MNSIAHPQRPRSGVELLRSAPRFMDAVEGARLVHLSRGGKQSGCTCVQFIAARHGEGVSSLAHDLAIIAARDHGLSTMLLVVNRSPEKTFEFEDETLPPASEVIALSAEGGPASSMVSSPMPRMNLQVATQGLVRTVAEWDDVLSPLCREFDFLIVDGPALVDCYAGVMISSLMDANLIVTAAENTPVEATRLLHERLMEAGGKVLGVILNKRRF